MLYYAYIYGYKPGCMPMLYACYIVTDTTGVVIAVVVVVDRTRHTGIFECMKQK